MDQLRCLGTVAYERDGSARALAQPGNDKPLELLLRVVASGPGGAVADRLVVAMWPDAAPRLWRASLSACMRRVGEMLDLADPLRADAGLVRVNEAALAVDSLQLEAALTPLLNPFVAPSPEALQRAHHLLQRDARAVFLPGIDDSWAVAARLRIQACVLRAESVATT